MLHWMYIDQPECLTWFWTEMAFVLLRPRFLFSFETSLAKKGVERLVYSQAIKTCMHNKFIAAWAVKKLLILPFTVSESYYSVQKLELFNPWGMQSLHRASPISCALLWLTYHLHMWLPSSYHFQIESLLVG